MAMETIIRKNRMGEVYYISQEIEVGEYDTKPTGRTLIRTKDKSIVVDHTIDKINQGWYNWVVKGDYIQTAFPFLTADEREFLMTSITSDEWAEIFGEKITDLERGGE